MKAVIHQDTFLKIKQENFLILGGTFFSKNSCSKIWIFIFHCKMFGFLNQHLLFRRQRLAQILARTLVCVGLRIHTAWVANTGRKRKRTSAISVIHKVLKKKSVFIV